MLLWIVDKNVFFLTFVESYVGQTNPAMMTFSKDRPVFLREYSTDHYSVVPYFLSKLWSEALNTFAAVISQALVVFWLMGFNMGFGQLVAITFCLAMTATAVAVMLGACFTNPHDAMGLFTLVVVPQFYFSGLFISIELIPKWVAWGQYLCSLTYASRLGFAYEFSNCEPGKAATNCESVLSANNVDVEATWWYWLALLGLFIIFRVGGVVLLRYKARY
jgi:ABC-type multidrug transport system permease subunit